MEIEKCYLIFHKEIKFPLYFYLHKEEVGTR